MEFVGGVQAISLAPSSTPQTWEQASGTFHGAAMLSEHGLLSRSGIVLVHYSFDVKYDHWLRGADKVDN